jgi:HEAT repeat protein
MTKSLGINESLTKDIAAVLESFSEKDQSGKQSLSQLLASNPRNFTAAAISVLAKCQASPGSRYLVHLLTKEKMLPAGLLDVRSTDLQGAVAAVRAVAEAGTNLQPMLELALQRALLDQPGLESRARILRLLEVLAAIAVPSCWNSFQLELMAYPDQMVRSKAALLVGRSTKNVAWIGRRFHDRDARVQASAVEALWAVEASDARPLLTTASKSKHNRVVANAALGLYRISDLKAISTLFDMARHQDPVFRISAFWAMGETQDPRFLPFLSEQFKTTQGKMRLAVTRAMASIRRREKANAEAGTLQIHVSQARAGGDGGRSIAFALGAAATNDFTSLKPTDFAISEGGALIEDYEVKLPNNRGVLAAGFVAPKFLSPDDPYAQAVAAALGRSSASKRPEDLWRIDRYSIQPEQPGTETPRDKSGLPYDEAIMTPELKLRQSFIAASDMLIKAISSEVPVERTAADSFRAIERQFAAVRKITAKRHVFAFLHHDSTAALEDQAHIRSLKDLATNEKIVLHGFAPGASHDCAAFRGLCRSFPEGTFTDTTLDQLPDALGEIYSALMNACEISYRRPAGVEPGPVVLKVSSSLGAGQADIVLRPDAAE